MLKKIIANHWTLGIMFSLGIIIAGSDGGCFPWVNFIGVLMLGYIGLIAKLFAPGSVALMTGHTIPPPATLTGKVTACGSNRACEQGTKNKMADKAIKVCGRCNGTGYIITYGIQNPCPDCDSCGHIWVDKETYYRQLRWEHKNRMELEK